MRKAEECSGCQIKMIKKKKWPRVKRKEEMKEQEGERRKRRRVNSSEGAVWLGQVETHTVTGRGGQGVQRE